MKKILLIIIMIISFINVNADEAYVFNVVKYYSIKSNGTAYNYVYPKRDFFTVFLPEHVMAYYENDKLILLIENLIETNRQGNIITYTGKVTIDEKTFTGIVKVIHNENNMIVSIQNPYGLKKGMFLTFNKEIIL